MLNVSAQNEHRRGPEEEGVGKRNFSTDRPRLKSQSRG